jgi:hypothetical protein
VVGVLTALRLAATPQESAKKWSDGVVNQWSSGVMEC